MKRSVMLAAVSMLLAGTVQAGDITCRGSITSIQGEGLVNRVHRFEVSDVTGTDVMAVLEQCKKIAQDRQNRAARSNPASLFRKFSDIDLQCVQGPEKFRIQRSLQTGR